MVGDNNPSVFINQGEFRHAINLHPVTRKLFKAVFGLGVIKFEYVHFMRRRNIYKVSRLLTKTATFLTGREGSS